MVVDPFMALMTACSLKDRTLSSSSSSSTPPPLVVVGGGGPEVVIGALTSTCDEARRAEEGGGGSSSCCLASAAQPLRTVRKYARCNKSRLCKRCRKGRIGSTKKPGSRAFGEMIVLTNDIADDIAEERDDDDGGIGLTSPTAPVNGSTARMSSVSCRITFSMMY